MKQLLTLTLISMLFGLSGCRESNPSTAVDEAASVQTFVVTPVISQGAISVAGVVQAHLESDLSAQMVAPVASITKREGDHFRKGDLLVRLDAPALDAEVAQAGAALRSSEKQEQAVTDQATLAAANLGRYAQLRERHSVTPYELDQMKAQSSAADAQQQSAAAQVSAARSALAIQRANAADANLYAPFDGVVARRLVDPGAMASPGVPLLHLQSAGAQDIAFSVPESLLDSLRAGMTLAVALGDGTPLGARVATIAPSGDAGSHSFLVKASLPLSSSWNSGTVVRVSLPSKKATSCIFVPSSSLLQQGGLDAVMAVDQDGRVYVRYVTLGSTNEGMTQVLTGVRPGDRLVTGANITLAGKKIVVRP